MICEYETLVFVNRWIGDECNDEIKHLDVFRAVDGIASLWSRREPLTKTTSPSTELLSSPF